MNNFDEVLSFHAKLIHHVETQPRKNALVRGGLAISYVELLNYVDRCLENLRVKGISQDSVAGVTIEDEIEHLIVTLALLAAGAKQITLASYDSKTVRYNLCRRVKANFLVTHNDEYQIEGTKLVLLTDSYSRTYSQVNKPIHHGITSTGVIFLYTSGTTSERNIVPFSDLQLALQTQNCRDYADERILRLASVEHNNSKRHRLYCLYMGGTSVLKENEQGLIQEYCFKHQVTCLEISRMHAAGLALEENQKHAHYMRRTKIRVAGSGVPKDLRRALQRNVTENIFVRYAATECGLISIANPDQHESESVGYPFHQVKVEVVDETGNPLPYKSVGEVRLKSPGMAVGYLDNPEQSAERFRDGWFYPGDIGEIMEDGLLVIHGRKDEMIILNSLNIFPAEIEKVLEQHPMVRESAVCAIDSFIHGQIPVAVVEVVENSSIGAKELTRYARECLGLRSPRKIIVVNKIPRNSQGKVDKRDVATLFKRPV